MSVSTINTPAAATSALCNALNPVGTETVPWQTATGRVLAQPLLADRDSPACDVSAMDGYALRLADVPAGLAHGLPVAGEARAGRPTPRLPPGAAMKIATGAPVPAEADVVIRREQTTESAGRVKLCEGVAQPGQYIRRQGENLHAGKIVVPGGSLITPPIVGALAAFGVVAPVVYRKLRVCVITTGDELLPVDSSPAPWQIRDANGPVLQSLLGSCPRIEMTSTTRAADEPEVLTSALGRVLGSCDAIILTGGVSMGDHDYVPSAINSIGATTLFHRLPIRPGHPILAAIGPQKQLILGLPGSPLAVMVGMCRFGRMALARLSGVSVATVSSIALADPPQETLNLWWYRPVTVAPDGRANLVPSRGSGDIPSAARSNGFVEMPPDATGPGPWPFHRWET